MAPKRAYNPYKRYCCVYGCLNKRKNKESELTFFKVPEDIERRQEWLTAINREDLLGEKKLKQAKHNFVCSAHFDDPAIITSISKRLTSDAVPTKLLPHKNVEPDADDSTVIIKNVFSQALPQTSKDISKKDNILVSTYSHTQSQTDTLAIKRSLPYEIECEIAKPNTDTSAVPSEPTPSTSQSQNESILSNKIIEPKVTSTSTQTDLNKTSNKMTQTLSALADQTPSKRKLKEEIEIVTCIKKEFIKIEKE